MEVVEEQKVMGVMAEVERDDVGGRVQVGSDLDRNSVGVNVADGRDNDGVGDSKIIGRREDGWM